MRKPSPRRTPARTTWRCWSCGAQMTFCAPTMAGQQCTPCRVAALPDLAPPPRPAWMDHPYRGCSPRALAEEGETPELFFPDASSKPAEARWEPFCGPCPVRDQCLSFGRQSGSEGVWGGKLLVRESVCGVDYSKRKPPGSWLLEVGQCRHGHPLRSETDLRFSWSTRDNRYKAECQACWKVSKSKTDQKRRIEGGKREAGMGKPQLTATIS